MTVSRQGADSAKRQQRGAVSRQREPHLLEGRLGELQARRRGGIGLGFIRVADAPEGAKRTPQISESCRAKDVTGAARLRRTIVKGWPGGDFAASRILFAHAKL